MNVIIQRLRNWGCDTEGTLRKMDDNFLLMTIKRNF